MSDFYALPDKDFIKEKFNTISPRYDFLNQILSLNLADAWRKKAADILMNEISSEASAVLDLGVGTGDFLKWFLKARNWARAVGVDFADEMLVRARGKLPASVELMDVDFQSLPFRYGDFDLVISSFTLRSVQDLRVFFREMARVLKPGGCVGLLELTRPRNLLCQFLFFPYVRFFLPFVGRLISGDPEAYQFLSESVRHFHSPEDIMNLLQNAGFESCRSFSFAFGAVTLMIGKKQR